MKYLSTPVVQKETLSGQVTRFLMNVISDKQLKAGDVVPSEMEISQTLQISRGIIRESYRALSSAGIISIQGGKRPRIQKIDPSVLAQFFTFAVLTDQIDAHQILELRQVIEVQTAALAATNGTDDDLKLIKEAGMRLHNCPTSHPEWIMLDYELHVAIASAVHNPLFTLVLQALRAPLEESIKVGLVGLASTHNEEKIVYLHDRIVEAICNRDSVGASNAMQEHFKAPVSALLETGIRRIEKINL